MKVLAITASGRRNGNVNNICAKLLEGAEKAGHEAELINLHDYDIKHCIGCLECSKTKKCIHKDDFEELFEKEHEADVIILAAPIYCHSLPGIMKDFIDRSCSSVIPYVSVNASDSKLSKLGIAREYMNGFKTNAPFKAKKYITVLACSNPSKNSSDFKAVNAQLKKFTDEMGSKIIKKIKCPDTLFRLNPNKINIIYQQAFALGAGLNSKNGN